MVNGCAKNWLACLISPSNKALSIGYRETVFDNSKLTIEVFILDFDGDLYNKDLDMIFVDYLRPQIKYDNWDLLKVQIEKDVGNPI